ncbi:hypothetical protein IHV25_05515 [Phaeovibrio sulfidiphilus]|uniref:Uncharacterized protein n=1 Tax=Phaeovibrio sulfidiphilus TaxID=1220600 RepID=A0A8J6YYY4_9PROT|nr:hypothetical protein [Phaeovibrio sulfidiphilus]MBE1237103.1 hypothetical protein [Phaeovibrio sulfidiphilus]
MKAVPSRFPSFFAAALSRVGLSHEEASALLETPVPEIKAWAEGTAWPPAPVWARLRSRERTVASLSGNLLASWAATRDDLNSRDIVPRALRLSPRGKSDAEMITIAAFLLAVSPDIEIGDDPDNGSRGLIQVDVAGARNGGPAASPGSTDAPGLPSEPPSRPTLVVRYTCTPGTLEDTLDAEEAILDMVFERGMGFFEAGETDTAESARTLRFYTHTVADLEALAQFMEVMLRKTRHVKGAVLELHRTPPDAPETVEL